MTYVVIYGVSTYGSSGQYASANAEDFTDSGQRIGTALGTWYWSDYGSTPVRSILARAVSATQYSEIKLSDGFYTTNKTEIDQWMIDNPNSISRITGSFIPLKGNISFASTPPGSEIFIDGADQGVKTPNTAMNIPAGSHTYVLKLAGYNDYSGTVSVISGQTATVSVTLIPACVPAWKCEIPLTGYETDGCGNRRLNPACNPPQAGSINFASTPQGAGIFLDGTDQGVKTPNIVSSVPVGTHAYTLRLPGYNDYTGFINVTLNQTATVSATLITACTPAWICELPLTGYETDGCGNRRLNPACNPPQTGSIAFISTPSGSDIFIDGADQVVKTPATISDIPVGIHTYTFKQVGYIDVTGTVDVGLNQTAIASATLIPVKKPGIGMGTILTFLLAAGAFGAVMFTSREPKLVIKRR